MKTLTLTESELPFDLDLTFSCGQIFGWKKVENTWSGVHKGHIISVRQDNHLIFFSGLNKQEIFKFLGLQDDISSIIASIRKNILSYNKLPDPFFNERYDLSKGLRIIRQDPWECLISFICSANSNVQTIGKRINLVLDRIGSSCSSGKNLFPKAQVLAQCTDGELRECLTGYRAPYLIKTAAYIRDHPDFFTCIRHMNYQNAKSALMVLPGVGPKVADCVLLFAFERFEAVPVDIRIRKIIESRYSPILKSQNTGRFSYDVIADFCREYFGPYAGYAQQFLFATRDIEKITSR